MSTLIEIIDEMTTPGQLVEKMDGQTLRCLACAHRCVIHEGKRGICRVRFNRDGQLQVPRGYVAGLNVDPIEKKPFNHFLPGSGALTFGMLGCNFHCEFCQNWLSSQVLRDASISSSTGMAQKISAKQIVDIALNHQAGVVASSYNEPVITAEWAHEVFSVAKTKGLKTVMISNGYATRECLEYLRPVMDGYKIDLKSMQDKNYRGMGGQLKHVLDSIQTAHDLGLWVEVVTLIIPGFQRQPGRALGCGARHCVCFVRYPLARYRVPPGLRYAGYSSDQAVRIAAGDRYRPGSRVKVRLCRQPARKGGITGRYPLPRL